MKASRLLLLSTALVLCSLATRVAAQVPVCPTTYLCSQALTDCKALGGKNLVMGFVGTCVISTTGTCSLFNFSCQPTRNPPFTGQCITCP